DRVIGLVELDDEVREREFTSDQIRLSQALADHAAIAIENARLFEAERKHSQELEALHEASLRLTSKLELQSVLEAILDYALRLAAATDAHIFLYDGERLSFGAALWANGQEESPYIEPRPEGLTYTVARTGKRIVVDNVNRHPLFKDWPWGGAIAGLPLRIGGQVCGVMNVAFDKPHTFEEDELRVLELLADQAAIAIRNAQLHAEVQALAITDSLTGFYNRRGLFELGRREVERARRFGRPLSALMLDLDHFKLVNDTYGHHIGDQVLAELAACCRQVLRDVDLLGRYGGEEFVFLLPETGVAAAEPVAERLRRHVERSLMNTDRGPISITISLGVAQLDETCPDLETLLEHADQALYVAKRSGRNQARVWQANDQDIP
ncbi:MAG: diguanylate cyclase, partial [Chloroflexi bacterium]